MISAPLLTQTAAASPDIAWGQSFKWIRTKSPIKALHVHIMMLGWQLRATFWKQWHRKHFKTAENSVLFRWVRKDPTSTTYPYCKASFFSQSGIDAWKTLWWILKGQPNLCRRVVLTGFVKSAPVPSPLDQGVWITTAFYLLNVKTWLVNCRWTSPVLYSFSNSRCGFDCTDVRKTVDCYPLND